MTNREKIQYVLSFVVDFLALVLSLLVSWVLFGAWLHLILPYSHSDVILFHLITFAAFALAYLFFGHTEISGQETKLHQAWMALRYDFLFAALLAIFLLITKNPLLESRYLFVGLVGFNYLFSFLGKLLMTHLLCSKKSRSHDTLTDLVGILTTSDRAQSVVQDLQQDWTKRIHGIALLDAMPEEIGRTIQGVPVVADYGSYMEWIRRAALDDLYIDIPYESGASLLPSLEELGSMGLNIHLNIPLLDRIRKNGAEEKAHHWTPHVASTLEFCGGHTMMTFNGTSHTLSDLVIKRTMDIVGGFVGCIISIPIIAVVAIPLKLESPGPLFFKQKRVGKNGRVFNIYKLRSMYVDAEERKKELADRNEMNGLMFKIVDDPRITKVGKFIRRTSIDELPQFFNVLRGDMSLVGTRPPTLDEYERYESHHKRRLSMKPGITGLWQVSGRSTIENFEDVVALDLQYIDNWSLGLDIQLLFKTVAVIFSGRGAE